MRLTDEEFRDVLARAAEIERTAHAGKRIYGKLMLVGAIAGGLIGSILTALLMS